VLSFLYPFLLLALIRALGGAGNASWAVPFKFYPVLVNAGFLLVFGLSLRTGRSQVFRLATLQDKSIIGSPHEGEVKIYCQKVTMIWCLFFILNGSVACWTALFAPDWVWTLYNGVLSYVLMGLLFGGEFWVRKRAQRQFKEQAA
jgi:uncharacterized membrane protein